MCRRRGPTAPGTAAPTAPGTAAPTAPGTYETLEEVAAAFGCVNVQDVGTGGNPRLSAFGVCYVRGHNIDIYMTTDRGQWEHLAAQFPSAWGGELRIPDNPGGG